MKLFCVPYAGGSSTIFSPWKTIINKEIEIKQLELPGHGVRMTEDLLENIEEVVEDLYIQVINTLKSQEQYALFGHSMGAVIVYELQRKLQNENLEKNLKHIFYSGRFPPHIPEEERIHELSNESLKEKLISMGGIPKEFEKNKELFDFFLPVLRSDFKLLETYSCDNIQPSKSDISIFYGTNDIPAVLFDLDEWAKYTKNNCEFYEFYGNHFFINDNLNKVIDVIEKKLKMRSNNK